MDQSEDMLLTDRNNNANDNSNNDDENNKFKTDNTKKDQNVVNFNRQH